MLNSGSGQCLFPTEFVSPKTKELNDYGLQYAKAIYYSSNRYGGQFYYGNSDFDSYVELAQGRQSVDNIKKLFGHYTNPNDPKNDGSSALAWIDIQVLNLAPKYVNRAVDKMQKLNYDVGLQAIDIVSTDEKETMMSAIQAFYRLKQWAADMQIDPQMLFPEIDISTLPEYPDEMLYDITVNPKIKKEIAGELTIKLVHAINNFRQKMREVDWDMVVTGRGHFHCYLDENGIPRVDRINPKFWGGSYVENDNFEDQEYAFFFDFITTNQFLKESSAYLTVDQQMQIIAKYASNTPDNSMFNDYRRLQNFDGLSYIPVMRFYFRSEDNRTFVQRKNKMGSKILLEKSFDYTPSGEVIDRYDPESGDSRVIKNTYTSIYGGTWVVDSDYVYNYKRQNYPRQNLVNATLPIKTFATNFREGRTVSFVSQMIEPLYMVNVAWNKIKEILAQGYMGILEIDFNQIESVAMGHGGNEWSPLEVVKFFLKKKILIKRGVVNKHEQSVGDGITVNNSGLTLNDYIVMLNQGMSLLEQMTGTSVTESLNVPDRLTAKSAELSQMSSDVDMGYLYNAHEYLFERTSHQLLLLAQESKSSGNSIRYFVPALGRVNSGFYDVPDDIAYCEYGMYITRQPGPEEWASFYTDVSLAVQAGLTGGKGGISLADSAYLREIDNLKQARQILAIRQITYERKAREEAQMNNQMAMEANSQAAQLKMEGEMAKIDRKAQADMELKKLDYMYQAKLKEMDMVNGRQNMLIQNQSKEKVEKDKTTGEIMKQAVRNTVEKLKIEKRPDKSPED